MRIPERIKIGGFDYEVRIEKIVNTEYTGRMKHMQGIIEVSPVDHAGDPTTPDQMQQTFLHEILHGIDLIFNAGEIEEAVIERLSHGLFQVIKDNPRMFYQIPDMDVPCKAGPSQEGDNDL